MVAKASPIYKESRKRSAEIAAETQESDEEFVTVRPVEGVEDSMQTEVRISCPDATGLGCDVARMLFDFGLRILEGDVSTDGKWCFLIFKVKLSKGVRGHWPLLKSRLKKICNMDGAVLPLWSTRPAAESFGPPFLLSVSSYDRQGFLHDLVHTLWEADVLVFKAHITTSPAGKVADIFWIYDHRSELPDNHRVLQIKELVKECIRQKDVEVTIESNTNDEPAPLLLKRSACVDASAFSPLRKIVSKRQQLLPDKKGVVITTETDEFGTKEQVQVSIDNCTTAAYSVVNIICNDRKGLVYDLMRTMKDVHIRVAYAKVNVRHAGLCEIDIFLQEVDGKRILDPELQEQLIETVRCAVALPLRVEIKDVFDQTSTELLVTAFLDSGGRGRPRVTFDVTTALSNLGLRVFMADVYIDMLKTDMDRPVELHRFLVHRSDGTCLSTYAEKKALYESVKAQLMGSDEVKQAVTEAPAARAASNAENVMSKLAAWSWG